VYKNQLDWSAYKKVPIVAVQLPLEDGSYDNNIVVSLEIYSENLNMKDYIFYHV
jgi:hypothetical protein